MLPKWQRDKRMLAKHHEKDFAHRLPEKSTISSNGNDAMVYIAIGPWVRGNHDRWNIGAVGNNDNKYIQNVFIQRETNKERCP